MTLKIRFMDMPSEFDPYNNYVLDILKQYYSIDMTSPPDFIFYSVFGYNHYKYNNTVKIFLCGEPVIPNFNDCDYAIGYVNLHLGNRYLRATSIFASSTGDPIPISIQNREQVDEKLFNRKFCNFIYSNEENGEGAKKRIDFCKKLMQYKKVDCPGVVLNNMRKGSILDRYTIDSSGQRSVYGTEWQLEKRTFQHKYKFSIAFESTMLNGMVSDKIMDPFYAYSIPIYWGNEEICEDINPKAFINCHDYGNDWDEVIKRIIILDQDKNQYLNMLKEKPMNDNYDFNEHEKLVDFILHIISRGNNPVRSLSVPYTFPPISAFSLSQSVPYFDNEDTIKAIRAYQSDTYKLVRKIQHFGHTRAGRIPRKCFNIIKRLVRKG